MVKKLAINAIIVGILLFASFIIEGSGNYPGWFVESLIIVAVIYAAISIFIVIVLPIYHKMIFLINLSFEERDRSKSYDELLKLKSLLERNIISQDEFDSKSRELKARIL